MTHNGFYSEAIGTPVVVAEAMKATFSGRSEVLATIEGARMAGGKIVATAIVDGQFAFTAESRRFGAESWWEIVGEVK